MARNIRIKCTSMSDGFTVTKERIGGRKSRLPFFSMQSAFGIRKIHEGDRSRAGGDLINFPFCLVNLRRCGIFARANRPLDFLSDTMRMRVP